MNSNECPVCGAEDYHYESGWQNGEPIEPDEAWCDKCGYRWQQHCKHPESEQIAKFKISRFDELQTEASLLNEKLKSATTAISLMDSTITEGEIEIDRLKEENKQAYNEGLRAYAWWKDGVQYVGSCGTTLKEALKGSQHG